MAATAGVVAKRLRWKLDGIRDRSEPPVLFIETFLSAGISCLWMNEPGTTKRGIVWGEQFKEPATIIILS